MHAQDRGRWVLAMADPGTAQQLARGLPTDIHVTVVNNGTDALDQVRRSMPEVLVCDMTLPGWDGVELIRRVSGSRLFTLPYVIVLALPGMEKLGNWARSAGACAVCQKPVRAEELVRIADALTPVDRLPRAGIDAQHIMRTLWTLGFSARMRGTRYLAMAIDLASRDVRLNKRLTTVLYPLVAQAHSVEQKRVEHAMRRAIESAWSGGSLEVQYRLFGNTIDAKRGKPTVGEMIACMAELLSTGMEMNP